MKKKLVSGLLWGMVVVTALSMWACEGRIKAERGAFIFEDKNGELFLINLEVEQKSKVYVHSIEDIKREMRKMK